MFSASLQLSLPDVDDARHFVPLQIMLEALCKVNAYHCRHALLAGMPYPPLYASGVRYKAEKPTEEDWPDIPAVLKKGNGDCEDLVAYRVGELRAAGYECEPVLKWQFLDAKTLKAIGYPRKHIPDRGVWLVHCLVRFPNGMIEDPSKVLGMSGNFMDGI